MAVPTSRAPVASAASSQPPRPPSRLRLQQSLARSPGEAKLCCFPDRKPQKASFAFRSEVWIPRLARGALQCGPASHHAAPASRFPVPCHCRSFCLLLTQCSSPPPPPLLRAQQAGPRPCTRICGPGSLLPEGRGWACLSCCHSHSRWQCLARSRAQRASVSFGVGGVQGPTAAAGPPAASLGLGSQRLGRVQSLSSSGFSLRPCCLFTTLDT